MSLKKKRRSYESERRQKKIVDLLEKNYLKTFIVLF